MYPTQYLIIWDHSYVALPWFFHINGVKHKFNVEYRYTILHSSNESKILEFEKERKSMLGTSTLFFFSEIKGLNVLKLLFTVNLYWFFFLQGFEGIEYLVIPVDNATLTEFTEQHESSVWEDAIGRRFMELRYIADISNKGRNLKFWERKKSINDTMYSCNWLYLFINWFDMQIKVYFDSKNSFILYYT